MTMKNYSSFPTKSQILEFINGSKSAVGKREIAKAFKLKGQDRVVLRDILKQLEADSLVDRGHKRRLSPQGALPEISVIEITSLDNDGELHAKPIASQDNDKDNNGNNNDIDIILTISNKRGITAKIGNRILAKLKKIDDSESKFKYLYTAEIIRILQNTSSEILGLLEKSYGNGGGGILKPTDKRNNKEFFIPEAHLKGAKIGNLILATTISGHAPSMPNMRLASVKKIIGSINDDKIFSLIAIYSNNIPHQFSDNILKQVENIEIPILGKRTDLRNIPLVTIDGIDARDFDDAVFAEADNNPENQGGWHLIVAIADVAHYVKYNSALDNEAVKRSNSVYFPDQVVPMLPEELSNGLCSLRPDQDRACLAVHMWISKTGQLLRHNFIRGLMRSSARLNYQQVQNAFDGNCDDITKPILDNILMPLYNAYQALAIAREKRGTLELEIAERYIILDDNGDVEAIKLRQHYDSHKLIEEFMICANVAAAEALEAKESPALYRIHEEPSQDKIEAIRQGLAGMGFNLTKTQAIRPHHFNGILKQAKDNDKVELISSIILRAQSQAKYSPDNMGHFGLALTRYCHFTSPIRRYADLITHRALISAYDLDDGTGNNDGLDHKQAIELQKIGDDISSQERVASKAEREVIDRYTTAHMSSKIGQEFDGSINGVAKFGLFITLDINGADGLIPIRTLPYDRYFHDMVNHKLIGNKTKLTFTLGDRVIIKLREANITTGGMIFELVKGGIKSKSNLKLNTKHKAKYGNKTSAKATKGNRRKVRIRRKKP